MELKGNTILITGGSSGIGLELAKKLVLKNNVVIICGRTQEKLSAAKTLVPQLHTFQCDISLQSDCVRLVDWIKKGFPDFNVLINNAAIVHKGSFLSDENIIQKAEDEIRTNYLGPIMLTKFFLPFLQKKNNPAIIYISTGLVYAPRAVYPIYCSTKAGLHSFVQTIRFQLAGLSHIKIIEVFMPAVDTPFHEGNPPKMAIKSERAVCEMLTGLIKEKSEIKVAGTKLISLLSRVSPDFVFKKINSI